MSTPPTELSRSAAASQGLWQKAFDSLPENQKAALNSTTTRKTDILSAVIRAAEDKRELCLRRQWKVKIFGSSHEIILRDILDKIAGWVDRFKAVGDVASQFDPAHAALPWAAVRFLLCAAVGDIQVLGAMLTGIETVSRLLLRCKAWEQLHQSTTSSAHIALMELTLVRLYAEMLDWLSNTINHLQKSTGARLFASTFQTMVKNGVDAILRLEAEACTTANIVQADSSQSSILSLRDNVTRANVGIARVIDRATIAQQSLDQVTRTGFLNWLSTVATNSHHTMVLKNVIPGSGDWIFGHPTYEEWINASSSSILLIQGVRGCGKSTLFSSIMECLSPKQTTTKSLAPSAHFYCSVSPSEPERASPEAIFRSIVRQLAVSPNEHEVHQVVWEKYEAVRNAVGERADLTVLQIDECLDLLLSLTASNPAYIGIDALDELTDEARATVVRHLQELVDRSTSVVKVLVTGRDNAHLQSLLSSAAKIRVCREDNEKDIERYCEKALEKARADKRILNGGASTELIETISKTLLQGSGEMFLWIRLQIEFLCHQRTEQDIRSALDKGLAEGLDNVYGHILDLAMDEKSTTKNILVHIFCWVLYAKTPVTSSALCSTLKLSGDDYICSPAQLESICHNLIHIDSDTEIVQFCHPSARDYVIKLERFTEKVCHDLMATCCLRQCIAGADNEVSTKPTDGSVVGLYHYSAVYWPQHLRDSSAVDKQAGNVMELLIQFIFGDEESIEISLPFIVWHDWIHDMTDKLPYYHHLKGDLDTILSTELSPLFVSSVFGLEGLMLFMLKSLKDIDINMRNDKGHTCLYLACANGHESLVSHLLASGADASIACGSYGSALQVACFRGHPRVTKLLLEREVLTHSSGVLENALEAAFLGGWENIVMLLLKHDLATLDQRIYELALKGGSQGGFEELVDWLLSAKGAMAFGVPQPSKLTAFSSAILGSIKNGHVPILRSFLSSRPREQENLPKDAIALAASRGKLEMMRYLRDIDQDIRSEGRFGSPLRSACIMGHDAIVQQLLQWGIESGIPETKGDPMQAAAAKGYLNILKTMIAHGASVNQSGKPYGNCLQAAAFNGHANVVLLLLDENADIYQEGKYKDALYAAIQGGHENIANLFMNRGYQFPDRVEIPAIARGDPKIIRFCPKGQEPVDEIDSQMSEDDVGDELENSGGPSVTDDTNDLGALGLCAATGDLLTLKLLLRRFYIPANEITEAMSAAISRGQLDIVRELVDNGLKHIPKTSFGLYSGLRTAAVNGQPEIVQFLLPKLLSTYKGISKPFNTDYDLMEIHKRLHDDIVSSGLVDCILLLVPYTKWTAMSRIVEDAVLKVSNAGNHEIADRILLHIIDQVGKGDEPEAMEVAELTASFGSLDFMKRYLQQESGSSDCNPLGTQTLPAMPLLAQAIRYNNTNTAVYLLDSVAKCDLKDQEISELFGLACAMGLAPIAMKLVNGKATRALKPEVVADGICLAITFGRTKLLSRIEKDTQFLDSISDSNLQKAVVHAAQRGHRAVLALILGNKTIQKRQNYMLMISEGLFAACNVGDKMIVQLCLENGADADSPAVVPPHLKDEHFENINKSYLRYEERKPIKVFDIETPPPSTSTSGSGSELFDQFTDHRRMNELREATEWKATSIQYANALHAALAGFRRFQIIFRDGNGLEEQKHRQEEIVLELLENGCDPNGTLPGEDGSLLRLAVQYTNERVVQALLDLDPDIELKDEETSGGSSLITLACAGSWSTAPGIVLQLLRAGSHIPITDDGSLSEDMLCVLDYALDLSSLQSSRPFEIVLKDMYTPEAARKVMQSGLRALVMILFKKLPNLEANEPIFGQILHLAAAAKDIACTNLLIKHGADVNASQMFCGNCLDIASRYGHSQIIKSLLQAGADATSSLDHAIFGGQPLAVKLLVEKDKSLLSNEHLMMAVLHGSSDCLNCLLTAADGTDYFSEAGKTCALVKACHQGKIDMVTSLLDSGASLNKLTKLISPEEMKDLRPAFFTPWGFDATEMLSDSILSPLYAACQHGNGDLIRLLVARGADVNMDILYELRFPLLVASSRGHLDAVKILLEAGANANGWPFSDTNDSNPDEDEWEDDEDQDDDDPGALQTPLWEACENGFKEIAQELLSHQASISCPPLLPNCLLAICCSRNPSKPALDTLELLMENLDTGEQSQETRETALIQAAVNGNQPAFEIMLEYTSPFDSNTLTLACAAGSLGGVRQILSQGVSASAPDQSGRLPLSVALQFMNAKIAELLLQNGADVNEPDEHGQKLLESLLLACKESLSESSADTVSLAKVGSAANIVTLFLDKGYELSLAQSELKYAAYIGDETIIRLLLDHGAKVNALGGYYGSALFAAIEGNQPKTVEILLEQGADPNLCRNLEQGDPRLSFKEDDIPTSTEQSPLEAALGDPSDDLLTRFLQASGDALRITTRDLETAVKASIWWQRPCVSIDPVHRLELETIVSQKPGTLFHEDSICHLITTLRESLSPSVLKSILTSSSCGVTPRILECAPKSSDLFVALQTFQNTGEIGKWETTTPSCRSHLRPGYTRYVPQDTSSQERPVPRGMM